MIEIEIVEVLTPISIDVNQTNEVVDIVIEQTTENIAIEIVEGRDGADGLSAYQIAVLNGFVGTEEEWLLSLVGAKGDTGDSGILNFSTNGDSGESTYDSGTKTLNVPNYSLEGLGGEPTITAGTVEQYWRGDKTWQTFPSISDLQQVTDIGNTTTNDIQLIDNAKTIYGAGGGILLDNSSRLREGTIDAGLGGSKGIAQICAVGYELKWEAGRLYVMDGNGIYIRWSLYNFNISPTINDDITQGYTVGSLWGLDNNSFYLCTDNTEGAAVWTLQVANVQTLQEVTDAGNTTSNDIIIEGANDFVGQISSQVITAFNNITGAYAELFVSTKGQLTLSDGTSAGILSINNLTNANVQLEFPNKTTGTYTIATTADIPSGTVTSVGLSMPSAFNVASSPITTNGTIAVTGAGLVSQYVRGDGTLANFPTAGGGGSSLSYYLNGSVSQGTLGGVAFKEMDKTPVLGAGTDFTINANGYIQSFITDAGVPNQLLIPAGNWNFEMYFSSSSAGGSPSFYIELYKLSSGTLTLIASNSATPEGISNGTTIDLYTTSLAVPSTTLLAADRLAIRVYVTHSSKTITLHTEDNHLCQVITTFSTGITALNGLTEQVQSFANDTNVTIVSSSSTHTITWAGTLADSRIASAATWNAKGNGTVTSVSALTIGTAGTDVTSTVATGTTTPVITLNIPTASASNRGALSSTDWSTFNSKIGGSGTSTQLAFFSATSTITSDSLLVWENTSKWLGIGMTPIMKLQVSSSASSATLPVAQLLRPNGTGASNKAIGYPYLLIGGAGEGATLNVMTSIGFGYNYSNIYFPFVEIGSQTTSTSGNCKGDFWIATRTGTTNVAATERIRVLSSGETGFGTSSPNIASLVDITSTTKGFLPPRMTTTQKAAISSPPAGLQVYDTTLNKMCVYTGSVWETMTSL